MKANYTYLSDGTKAAAYTSASAGKDYVGSFTYTRGSGGSKTLENVAFLRAAHFLYPAMHDELEALIDDLGLEFMGEEKVP